MKVTHTDIADVLVFEPRVHQDARGFFLESYNRRAFEEATGLDIKFVQDNTSFSVRNVLRGLHYQIRQPQGKLIQVDGGRDLRRRGGPAAPLADVPKVGRRHAHRRRPPHAVDPGGFAHGYLVLSEHAIVLYKTTDYYAPEHERSILWNDAELGIRWPLEAEPIVSDKDRRASAVRARPTCSIEDSAHRPERPGRIGARARIAGARRGDRQRPRHARLGADPGAIRRVVREWSRA